MSMRGDFKAPAGLDVHISSGHKRQAWQDGIPIDLFDVIEDVKLKEITGKSSARVECPVCAYATGILLSDIDRVQTRKCSWCHNVSKFKKNIMGEWDIMSIVGTERIDKDGKHWKDKRI